jgi:predicted NAD/FAD-binding protein
MSFAVSLGKGRVEYSSDNLLTMLGHASNLVRPAHWRMLSDLVRFCRQAHLLYAAPVEQSLGDYLDQHHYSEAFRKEHLLPMAAAIWSAKPEQILNFPAQSFGHFFRNHGLLELNPLKRPPWRTVKGGSRVYVNLLAKAGGAKIVMNANIASVKGGADKAVIIFNDGSTAEFDNVVFASHADETLKLMQDTNAQQRELLGYFHYSSNATYLHQVVTLMLLVSLNPPQPPATNKTLKQMTYTHPQFDASTLKAQKQMHNIQGKDRLWFCGSYFGYGFHEDGLASGFGVAEALGARRPWAIKDVSPAFANARGKP